jgi:hypothetical protein
MGVIAPGEIVPIELEDEGLIRQGLDFLRETFGN